MGRKEFGVLADVRAQCKDCGHAHVYDGVYKRQHLKKIQKEGFTEACDRCHGELVLVKLLPCQVPARPEMDVLEYLARVKVEVMV